MSPKNRCPECYQEVKFLSWCGCYSKHFQNDFDKWTCRNNAIDKFIQDSQINATSANKVIEWIPYDRFKNINEIAKGGFGTIYKAEWIDGPIERWDIETQQWKRWGQRDVALKKFDNNFADLNKDFLNEIEINLKTNNVYFVSIQIYGVTQDPETNKYIMVSRYMSGGNLRDYLKKDFKNINWKQKLGYLQQLVHNFDKIHKLDIIHRDFHPGNILSWNFKNNHSYISDFGLSKLIEQNVKNPEKKQIFGVLPYIAPEVLSGEEYTKAADVYSFSIVAYEIVTGFAPYYDIPHDKDLARKICNGLRPKIPFHIPKLITRIIMRCWDARVTHRPTFGDLQNELIKRYSYNFNEKKKEITIEIKQSKEFSKNKEKVGFLNLIRGSNLRSSTNSTTLTPMNYKTHPEAIYTSRLLNYSNLPKPKNDENFEKELEELSKSTSTSSIRSIITSKLHVPDF